MVPNGWKPYSLADVTSWSSGGTPSKSNSAYWGGDIPWISAASMKGHYYSVSGHKITELAVTEKAKMAEKGTILLLVRGSMLWNKIPVGIATRKVAFNQDVKCISPKPKVLDITFLLYWFLAKENKLMGMVTGTGIGAGKLDTNDLQSLDLFLPPHPEQRKIATILGTWDKAIRTTESLIDNSKQQKKALMQQLLTGKKRLLDDTGKPFEGEWEEVTLGDVITHQKGYAFKSASYLSFGTRIIRISDTNIDSIHDNSPVFINEGSEGDLNSYKLTTGDIILSTVGSRPHLLDSMVGKAVRIPKKDSNSLLNQNLVKLSPVDGVIINEYLYIMLKENRFIYFISTLVRGNANQVSITLKELFSYKLILPLFEEQQKISSALTNAAKEVELLEQQLADLKQEKKALMQQLLTGKRRVKVDNTEAA
jgi:type I restriction enzyme S subunit